MMQNSVSASYLEADRLRLETNHVLQQLDHEDTITDSERSILETRCFFLVDSLKQVVQEMTQLVEKEPVPRREYWRQYVSNRIGVNQ